MAVEIKDLLTMVVEKNASDLHLAVGKPPVLRLHGHMKYLNVDPLTPQDTERFMKALTSEKHQQKISELGGTDFGFAFGKLARFRVSVFRQKGHLGLVLRLIPYKLLTIEDLGLPPSIKELLYKPRGLVLVTGPTGSGKTTTLASMINYINENRSAHIITVEDPIEYYHPHKNCVVTQREVGADVSTFSEAVMRALRQDPDVILVGEMRDLATMASAISAAETGHLVFATLHTTGAARTVDRIIDAFPTSQQAQVRTQLSSSLAAVVSQVLLTKTDGEGRVAAFEIMICTAGIGNMVREDKTFRIPSAIQTGGRLGMTTMDASLQKLYAEGLIAYEDVLAMSYDTEEMAENTGQGKGR